MAEGDADGETLGLKGRGLGMAGVPSGTARALKIRTWSMRTTYCAWSILCCQPSHTGRLGSANRVKSCTRTQISAGVPLRTLYPPPLSKQRT